MRGGGEEAGPFILLSFQANNVIAIELFMIKSSHCFFIISEAEFLDDVQKKALRIFLLAIHSLFNGFALRFLFLQTHSTSYTCSYYISVTVHCKGERRKT